MTSRSAALVAPAIAPSALPQAERVRALLPEDMPAIARLFQSSFRAGAEPIPDLRAYLRELFVDGEVDADLPSRVHLDEAGEVVGFLGAIPLAMSLRGRPVRAAVPTTLMVDQPSKTPFAALSLLKAFLGGPQDLCLTDTASPLVRALWERLGGAPADHYGLDWWRILRPAGFAACMLGRERPPGRLVRGMARAADGAFAAVAGRRNPFLPEPPRTQAEEVDAEAFLAHLDALTRRFALRPVWDDPGMPWRLAHAARRTGSGAHFRRVVLSRGRVVGCYLYNVKPGEVARVMELAAEPASGRLVLADLFAHAAAEGAVAVRGRAAPALVGAFAEFQCFYTRRLSTLVHARDPDILAAVAAGDALVTGLAGDTWTRLFDDEFK